MKKFCFVLLLTTLFSHSAFAGFDCTGDISGVSLRPSGKVVVKNLINWNWQTICSVSNEVNGVNPEACKAIYSLLLTAQTTDKDVTFWFDAGDCSAASQTTWGNLSNWYFGPMLVD